MIEAAVVALREGDNELACLLNTRVYGNAVLQQQLGRNLRRGREREIETVMG